MVTITITNTSVGRIPGNVTCREKQHHEESPEVPVVYERDGGQGELDVAKEGDSVQPADVDSLKL
jgi:hypothetical protein